VVERRISRGSATPLPQGDGPQPPQFLGFPSIFFLLKHTPFDAELPNLTWEHTWGGGLFLGGQSYPIPILWIPFYLCLHPLTQKDQIRHGKTYVERRVFRKSATSLHWHECVARFVSDSDNFLSVLTLQFLLRQRTFFFTISQDAFAPFTISETHQPPYVIIVNEN